MAIKIILVFLFAGSCALSLLDMTNENKATSAYAKWVFFFFFSIFGSALVFIL